MEKIKLMAAPECQPIILAAAPRIVTEGGRELLQVIEDPANPVGTTKTYRILKQFGFPGVPVVFVLVQYGRNQALFFLPQSEEDQGKAPNLRVVEPTLVAEGLISAVLTSKVYDAFPEGARVLWDAGMRLEDSEDAMLHRLGQLMALDAVLSLSWAATGAFMEIREQLKMSAPSEALMPAAHLQGLALRGLEDTELGQQQQRDEGAMRAWAVKDPQVRQDIRRELYAELNAKMRALQELRAGEEGSAS